MMTANSKPKQVERVLVYMRQFGSITQHQASLDLGVQRLASRVSELRKMGYTIEGKMVPVKNRFGETCHVKQYSLGKEDDRGNH